MKPQGALKGMRVKEVGESESFFVMKEIRVEVQANITRLEKEQTSDWRLLARESEEPFFLWSKRMTGVEKLTGATSNLGKHWKAINWKKVETEVKRLQMRIAKAERRGERGKVKVLQRILSHSLSAKLLAVQRVTSRKGAKTAGIDGITWNTPVKKMRGALSLQRKGYKAKPLRRVTILKKNGGKRHLGIPVMKDRAMQMLYLLTLDPVAETTADRNSYGFRSHRGCRDAISQCFKALAKSNSARWILDADIKACFDGISHKWLMDNITMDKKMLDQWLKCGYFEKSRRFPTKTGTPQGGVISPTLANMALDGLEKVIKGSCSKGSKVNFIRYADDFIVTSVEKTLLEDNVIPAINRFLKQRGLELSPEKTKIVRIEEGFDFLGQNMRKFRDKLITTPAKKNRKTFLNKVRTIISESRGCAARDMIKRLNPVILGWANYHRYVQAAKAFSEANTAIFHALMRWARREHPNKSKSWIIRKHFSASGKEWLFSSVYKDRKGRKNLCSLTMPSSVKLMRYIKVQGAANPYDPNYLNYFKRRNSKSNCFVI